MCQPRAPWGGTAASCPSAGFATTAEGEGRWSPRLRGARLTGSCRWFCFASDDGQREAAHHGGRRRRREHRNHSGTAAVFLPGPRRHLWLSGTCPRRCMSRGHGSCKWACPPFLPQPQGTGGDFTEAGGACHSRVTAGRRAASTQRPSGVQPVGTMVRGGGPRVLAGPPTSPILLFPRDGCALLGWGAVPGRGS